MGNIAAKVFQFLNSHKLLSVITILLTLMVLVFSVKIVATLVDIAQASTLPFDRDEAQHAIDGWEVYHAFAAQDYMGVIKAIRDQASYPPVHSFFVAVWYFLGEPGLVYSRLPSVANFGLLLIAIAWTSYNLVWIERGKTDWTLPLIAAVISVSLAITGKSFVSHAALCMLEYTGALIILLIFLYIDAGEENQSLLWLVGTALLIWVLFLVKYPFGVYLFLGFYAGLLLHKNVLENFTWLRIFKSIVLVLIIGLLIAIWSKATYWQGVAGYFSLQKELVDVFQIDRYFSAGIDWFIELSISPLMGIVSIVLCIIGTAKMWPKLSVRTAFWTIVFTYLIVSLLQYGGARHLIIIAPFVWVLAGVGFIKALIWLRQFKLGYIYTIFTLVAFVIVSFIGFKPFLVDLGSDIQVLYETKSYHRQIQDLIVESVDLETPVLLVGDWKDTNSLLNLRWRAGIINNLSLWDLTIDQYPFSARENMLAITNRKLQLSEEKPFEANSSLKEVVHSDYYDYLVEILFPKQQKSIAPDELFAGVYYEMITEGDFDGHQVLIYHFIEK